MREMIMSINDFMEVQKGNLTYDELILRERLAEKILNDERLKAITICTLGSLMYCQSALAADLDKIDSGGAILLNIVRRFGYWVCIIMCIAEIIRSLMQGDTKSIGKVTIKYSLAYASFHFLPWLFDIIKDIFK